jgi:hypothetical protein
MTTEPITHEEVLKAITAIKRHFQRGLDLPTEPVMVLVKYVTELEQELDVHRDAWRILARMKDMLKKLEDEDSSITP